VAFGVEGSLAFEEGVCGESYDGVRDGVAAAVVVVVVEWSSD